MDLCMRNECQVLIVEPDAGIRLDLKELLSRAGYQVMATAGTLDARHVLNHVRVQVVICASELVDALTAVVRGASAIRETSAHQPANAVIVADTARLDSRDPWSVSLSRPIVLDELLTHVAQRVSRRRDYVRTEAD